LCRGLTERAVDSRAAAGAASSIQRLSSRINLQLTGDDGVSLVYCIPPAGRPETRRFHNSLSSRSDASAHSFCQSAEQMKKGHCDPLS